jgi:hypothetical protein
METRGGSFAPGIQSAALHDAPSSSGLGPNRARRDRPRPKPHDAGLLSPPHSPAHRAFSVADAAELEASH